MVVISCLDIPVTRTCYAIVKGGFNMKIETMTWKELSEEPLNQMVVFLSLAPVEAHGHHLPLSTDCVLTKKWCRDVVDHLSMTYDVLSLPMIPVGYSGINDMPGNMYVSQDTLFQLVKELLEGIASWGVRHMIVLSAHADPKHQIAIEQACECVNGIYGKIAMSPMGAIFSGEQFNPNEEVNKMMKNCPEDYHAGWIETSLMLYYDENTVRPCYNVQQDIVMNPREMMFADKVVKQTKNYGHLGYPSKAQKTLGESLHRGMVDTIIARVVDFLEGKDISNYEHHVLYSMKSLQVEVK